MTESVLTDTVVVDHCDHCGNSNTSVALEAAPWTLVECSECGFVFTSPRLSDAALARIYSEEYYENASDYAAQQIDAPSEDHLALARTARKLLSVGTQRLMSIDIGCGGGRLVAAFQQNGFDAYGVEPSKETVRRAQEAGLNIALTDISDLPENAYDCVTLMHVLEHVTSPSEFAGHLHRITKPGGLCIIEVPNFASKAARSQGATWYALHPSTHLSHFTPTSLANAVRKAGFSVRSVHRLGGAGVFSGVSDAVKVKNENGHNARRCSQQPASVMRYLWQLRQVITSVPTLKRMARWVNWELLGHGEYVRIFATKPHSA